VTVDEINSYMRKHNDPSFGYTDEEIVSGDIIGDTHGGVFDATQTKVIDMGDKSLVQIASWYDNEYGYTTQMVRVAKYLKELL
jgi:glyceraldehyde 3-phosphate dehydrogenase